MIDAFRVLKVEESPISPEVIMLAKVIMLEAGSSQD